MALPPTIPTSFVPKQPTSPGRQHSGVNSFLVGALIMLAISIAGAGLVFGYEKYLESVLAAKQAALEKAKSGIDQDQVQGFIRLQSRLSSAKTLLDNHIASSQFLDLLETVTLQNVRFSALKLTVAQDRSAKVELDGTARTFNALAAESQAFASDKRIKRAIFSGITPDKSSAVNFKVTADIDPSLLAMAAPSTAAPVAPQAPAATTSPTATTTGL